jgi:hypothetical protein
MVTWLAVIMEVILCMTIFNILVCICWYYYCILSIYGQIIFM